MSVRDRIAGLGRDEGGIAMLVVILLGAIIVLLLTLVSSRTMSDIHQTHGDRLLEQAFHTGDSGVDEALVLLGQNRHYHTVASDEHPDTFDSSEDEEAWVLQKAEDLDPAVGPDGEYVVVKPQAPTIADAECPEAGPRHPSCVIYSVGYTPAKDPARRMKVRVVKAEYALGPDFEAQIAVQSDGELRVSGSLEVTGAAGSAHANGNVHVDGSPHFDGFLAASGTCNDCDQADVGDPDNTGSNKPERPLPIINPRENYMISEYDLCPDGSVRTGPAYQGPSPPNGTTQPCQGTALATTAGWSYGGQDESQGALWSYEGTGLDHGVFYVYKGSAEVSGNPGTSTEPWEVTILAEASPTTGPEPHCPHEAGDIVFSGNPRIEAYQGGPLTTANPLVLVAGRDIQVSGNTNSGFNYDGAIAAHEQINMSGNPRISGPVLANDTCPDEPNAIDLVTGKNGINVPKLTGNVTIHYDGGLRLPFGRTIHMPSWREL